MVEIYFPNGTKLSDLIIISVLTLKSPDAATTGTIGYTNAEEMVFTVAAGGKFKFVVS